jgi:RNA polymerase sigma factor (sigma-70 family)
VATNRLKGVASAPTWIDSPALRALVARVSARYGLPTADVPDLLQETRIALWEVGPAAAVSAAWVIKVATNKAVDLLRRTSRVRTIDRAFAARQMEATGDLELERLLHARISELPARLRAFHNLHYTEGWSEREIARAWGLCRASVRWLDHQFRSVLVEDAPAATARLKQQQGRVRIAPR